MFLSNTDEACGAETQLFASIENSPLLCSPPFRCCNESGQDQKVPGCGFTQPTRVTPLKCRRLNLGSDVSKNIFF